MFRIILKFDDVVNGQQVGEYEVAINFNDFAIPSFESRVELANKLLSGGTADVRTAIDVAWLDDKTEDEKDEMALNTKIENGVPLTTDEVDTTT